MSTYSLTAIAAVLLVTGCTQRSDLDLTKANEKIAELTAANAQLQQQLAAKLAASSPDLRRGVFLYSSLCEGPADPRGEKITIEREPYGTFALYVRTEGPIMAPLLAFGPDVQIDDRTGAIRMRFEDRDSNARFLLEGTITAEMLALKTEDTVRQIPREHRITETLPDCPTSDSSSAVKAF